MGRGEGWAGCVVYDYIAVVFCRDKTKISVRQGRNACSEWTVENLVVEIKNAGIMWIMCWVEKQMWRENIKGFCLDCSYNKKLLDNCIAMSSSTTSLSPVNNYGVGAF